MSSLEFRLKKIDEAMHYVIEEIRHNDLLGEKYKKTWKYLNHNKHLFTLASASIGSVSIPAFASLICIPVGIASSAVGIKICTIIAGIKDYEPIIKKYHKIVLLRKTKLDTIDVLIYKALIDWHISRDEFVSVNTLLREFNEMKKEIKILCNI